MQAAAQPELPYLRTSGIILAGEDDTSSKLNGIVDASISESTPSHASLDIGQDYSLPASGQTPSTDGRAQISMSWPNHLPQSGLYGLWGVNLITQCWLLLTPYKI
ncbi:COP1-interacting protein 7 [Glycine max]|uniref:Uncharacterized protein n=1 Tax=Glycine max TaxID=3847 RepID=A0A0R0KY30_SOYBN|nr:hypothetical protein JHK86_004704 [Glycine max]KAH1061019.1 hypothetical protein GYH30_004490 [Glycine max]KAH1262355.1 COP1-interacting protein 7 [Glycine max]|eukprot:XP_025983345.1 COP1-interacting protein 7 [Glycine max]